MKADHDSVVLLMGGPPIHLPDPREPDPRRWPSTVRLLRVFGLLDDVRRRKLLLSTTLRSTGTGDL